MCHLLAALLVGRIWLEEFQSLATFLGLVSAGLAIAMKDPLVNVAGWLFIDWRRPFDVSDRIQIGLHAGDVIDVRIFQFTIMEIGNWVQAPEHRKNRARSDVGVVASTFIVGGLTWVVLGLLDIPVSFILFLRIF